MVRAQPLDPSQEAQDFTVAYGLFKDAQYQLALEEFDRFLDHRPLSSRRPDAAFLMAECLMHLGRSQDAQEQFDRFTHEYPSSPLAADARFRIAELTFGRGEWTRAIAKFRSVVAEGRSDLAGEALYWIGESYFKLGRSDSALAYYRRSFDRAPSGALSDYALFSTGWVHQQEQNYPTALQAYEDFSKRFPLSPLAPTTRVRIAEVHLQSGKPAISVEMLRAVRPGLTGPDDIAEATYLLGEAYYRLAEYRQAQAWYDSFMVCCAGHRLTRDAQYSRAWVLLEQNKGAEAATAFLQLSGGQDAIARASQFRAGVALKSAGRRGEAEALFQAVASSPGNSYAPDAMCEIGALRFEDGKRDSASAMLTALLARYPTAECRGRALFLIGTIHHADGKEVEALASYRDALAQPGGTDDLRADVRFEEGLTLARLNRHDEAATAFRTFARDYPKDSQLGEALFWLGESAFRNGEYNEADSAYAAALTRAGPERAVDVVYGRAWAKYRLGDFRGARLLFDRLSSQYPSSRYAMDARVRGADCLYSLREYAKAIASYREVLRLYATKPGTDYVRYQLAGALVRAGSPAEGIREYQALVSENPRSDYADDARYGVGWVYFQRKEYPRAIREFRETLSAYPRSDLAPRITCSLGDAYYNSGDYAAAASSYRDVLVSHPESESVTDALKGVRDATAAIGKEGEGETLVRDFLARNSTTRGADRVLLRQAEEAFAGGNMEDALGLYTDVLEKHPGSALVPSAALGAGRSAEAMERRQEAERWFRIVVERYSGSDALPGGLLGLGRLMNSQQRFREAITYFERVEKADPSGEDGVEATFEHGMALLGMGDSAGALARFESLASEQGESKRPAMARLEAARIYAGSGRYDRATAYFAKAAQGRSDDIGAEAQTGLGELLLSTGKTRDAVAALARVRYLYPGSALWIARSTLGMADGYLRLNEAAKARTLYASIVEEFPDSPSAASAAQKLQALP